MSSANCRFIVAVHGGAGVIPRREMTPGRVAEYRLVLEDALRAGAKVLQKNGSSVDAVIASVMVLEDSPLFNAARGAVLNSDGQVELDAAVMNGATRKAGSVACVKRLKNPICAAQLVMDRSAHVILAGDGAESFAEAQGADLVPNGYFITEDRRRQFERIQRRAARARHCEVPVAVTTANGRFGTVGAVALDRRGNLAAGTSTGGVAFKHPGRVGDSPLIGAGTYADNATCAVSATGEGEFFIRCVAAHAIASLMAHCGWSVTRAANEVVRRRLAALGGRGGVIALDRFGRVTMPFTTKGMYRGYLRDGSRPQVRIRER